METIKAYAGDKPYLFVSYAHADAPAVMEVLEALQEQGFRIWYDEGIEVGSDWPEFIAGRLAGSGLMLAFLSKSYLASDNCRKEMHFALSHKIETVNIFLEETALSPGMEMQIGNRFALMKYQMGEERFLEKLLAAPQLDRERFASEKAKPVRRKKAKKKAALTGSQAAKKKKKRLARRIVALSASVLLLAACITLGIIGWSTGLARRIWIGWHQQTVETLPGDTVAVFSDQLLEQAARDYTGIARGEITVGDLTGITELYLEGDRYSFSALPEGSSGEGQLRDLSDLVWFTGLRRLVLCGQPLSSLETMPVIALEYLELRDCKVASLQGIGNLPELREIVTNGCPITQLGDLEQCLDLRRASLLDAYVNDFSAFKPLTKLAEFTVSNASIDALGPVLGHSKLTDVAFYSCDLRGRFFKSFDRERGIVSLTLVDCKLNSTVNLGDFTGLTTLRLIGTGEDLDWSALAELERLSTVYVDAATEPAVGRGLGNSGASLVVESD
jgi:hypothetical protein